MSTPASRNSSYSAGSYGTYPHKSTGDRMTPTEESYTPGHTPLSPNTPNLHANYSNSSLGSNNRSNNNNSNNNNNKQANKEKKIYLDISGPFPYFEEEKEVNIEKFAKTKSRSRKKKSSAKKHKKNNRSHSSTIQYYDDDDDDSKNHRNNPNNENVNSNSSTNKTSNHTHKKKRSKTFSLMEDKNNKNKNVGIPPEQEERELLSAKGYFRKKFLAKTLQGEVFLAARLDQMNVPTAADDNSSLFVVKKTSKKLHNEGITITATGKKIRVHENIVREAEMLEVFHANSPPSSLIKQFAFLEDSTSYYLIMEHGGQDFFDFVVECHDLIQNKKLQLSEWRKHCKFMFAQMVQFIRWMHQTMNCCNLDVSLENVLIRDTAYFNENTGKLHKCYVKFIDFGLSEFFDQKTNPTFDCNKYVGKTHYKAPKVYGKKETFNAKKADIWSLGVCLFMMIVGAPPYNKPTHSDITFQYVKYGQLAKLLQEWGRIKYVTQNLHDLLSKMLCYDESKRITMEEIVKHPWIKSYFPQDNLTNMNGSSRNSHNGLSVSGAHAATSPRSPGKSMFPPTSPNMSNNHSQSYKVNHAYPASPYSPNTMGRTHSGSKSVSQSVSMQPNPAIHVQVQRGMNIMIPQQNVSYSVTSPSASSQQRRATVGNGRVTPVPLSTTPIPNGDNYCTVDIPSGSGAGNNSNSSLHGSHRKTSKAKFDDYSSPKVRVKSKNSKNDRKKERPRAQSVKSKKHSKNHKKSKKNSPRNKGKKQEKKGGLAAKFKMRFRQ